MKMDLNDTGILLIVRIDTKERLENAIAITDFLVKHFNAPIYMWEIDAYNNGFLKKLIPTKVKYTFRKDYDPILHRTRYINKMVDYVQEPYVAIWDIDVIAHPNQIKKAVELL